MDEEIILDRGDTEILKLDENEQALMDEIQIAPTFSTQAQAQAQAYGFIQTSPNESSGRN